jgi:hypothetical protein
MAGVRSTPKIAKKPRCANPELILLFTCSDGELFPVDVPDGPRAGDFRLLYDAAERCDVVIPDPTRGLSFADSIERLAEIPIGGRVWLLPKGAMLPEGLVFNYKSLDHPMLNVSRRMTVVDLTTKLAAVSALLKPTDTVVPKRKRSQK